MSIVNREAAGLLARWKFLERGEKLADVLLRRHHHEGVVHPPASVVDVLQSLQSAPKTATTIKPVKFDAWITLSAVALTLSARADDPLPSWNNSPAQGLPDTKVGTFTQALYEEAKKDGWIVISMKKDWKVIFPFENK